MLETLQGNRPMKPAIATEAMNFVASIATSQGTSLEIIKGASKTGNVTTATRPVTLSENVP